MNKQLQEINEKISLAQEYSDLISLPRLSEEEQERLAEILELANFDEYLGDLIDKVEVENYLNQEEDQNKGLLNLHRIVSGAIIVDQCETILFSDVTKDI
ncbi:MAG: hypothetical protein AAF383_16055 [Cyanobacteria bacterium P01_A01_bin.83]